MGNCSRIVIGAVAIVVAEAIFNGVQHNNAWFSGDAWLLVANAGARAALLVWLSLSYVRGRYTAALSGDLEEMSLDDPQGSAVRSQQPVDSSR